ncbi:MAG: HNH endonuclease [Campylobacteraceae bacterium]|nr:HNH endonuclease [Campylobacteraceae bacterium]
MIAIQGTRKRYGFLTGRTGRFEKGHNPFNKGKKGYMGANRTSFKKGHIPKNYRHVGSVRINKDGYVEIKIADPNKWRLKHLVIWEAANGKVPKGHCISFLDKNRTNCALSNLVLLTRNEELRFNKRGYNSYDTELHPVLRNVVRLDIAIKKAKK